MSFEHVVVRGGLVGVCGFSRLGFRVQGLGTILRNLQASEKVLGALGFLGHHGGLGVKTRP